MIKIEVDNKKTFYRYILFTIVTNTLIYLMMLPGAPVKSDKGFSKTVIAKLQLYTPFEKFKNIQIVHPTSGKIFKEVTLIKQTKVSAIYNGSNNFERIIIKLPLTSLNDFLSIKDEILEAYPIDSPVIVKRKNFQRRNYEMAF